jgi:hypothetical protein
MPTYVNYTGCFIKKEIRAKEVNDENEKIHFMVFLTAAHSYTFFSSAAAWVRGAITTEPIAKRCFFFLNHISTAATLTCF